MNILARCAVLFGLASLVGGCQVTEDQLENYVKARGFTVVVSPSTLYGPGSLVYRKNYEKGDTRPVRVALGYLCDPRYVSYPKAPLEGETLGQFTITKFDGSISAGVPALRKALDLSAKLKGAARVTANIYDARVYAYAKENLAEIKSALGPGCRSIVNDNVRASNAHHVIQALRASVDIAVEMDAGIDATAAAKLKRELANLGFNFSASHQGSLKVTALFVGVELDPVTEPIQAPSAPLVASRE